MFNLFNRLPGIVRVLLWMALPPLAAALVGAWAISHHTGGAQRPVQLAAAWVAAVAGLAAALWGGFGIWAVRCAGRRAMHSRDELLTAFSRWHAGLPRYLGLLLALVLLAFLALLVMTQTGALITITIAWGAGAALWRLRRPMPQQTEPNEILGLPLAPAQAPGLWRYARELAARVGVEPPDNIVLGVSESFCVTSASLRAMPAAQLLTGRTLHLPLTYLCLLRRDETDAIVAHELGHFLGEDSAYSMRFMPLYASMEHALHSVVGDDEDQRAALGSIPAAVFGLYLLESFHGAVSHWDRVRELQADAVSARVTSAETATRALVHVSALEPLVHERLDAIARRPAQAGQDLIAMLLADVQARPLQAPDLDAEAATSHPYDTHPPTLERLRALGLPTMPALTAPDADTLPWVRSLFSDYDAVQRQLLADFKAVAADHNERMRRELTEISQQAQGHVTVYESRMVLWLYALAALGAGAIFLRQVADGVKSMSWSWGMAIVLAACVAFAALAWRTWRRSQAEIMTLTPEALYVSGLRAPLGWGDIDDVRLQSRLGIFEPTFILTPEARLPESARNSKRRVRICAKKRSVTLQRFDPRRMSTEQLCERLHAYFSAWHARKMLDEMQGEEIPSES